MRNSWLLCDFHIHTDMSDGSLPVDEVVDMYGSKGFDVISITDHILDSHTFKEREEKGESVCAVRKDKFKEYLCILWREAERAWKEYNMLLIPGAEVTNNHKWYHILALDVKGYIDPTLSVEEIVKRIHDQQAIAVACHPDLKKGEDKNLSWYLWKNHEKYRNLFDAWEVANRDDLYNVIGLKKLNYIANSDFHESRHLYSWKSLIESEKNTEAVKSAIRENKNIAIYLFRKQ
ncbi:phosphotransferase [candidate division WOR-3 bacterium]|nr:phosphotransferase [candidate division WOR-3 bacterium]